MRETKRKVLGVSSDVKKEILGGGMNTFWSVLRGKRLAKKKGKTEKIEEIRQERDAAQDEGGGGKDKKKGQIGT